MIMQISPDAAALDAIAEAPRPLLERCERAVREARETGGDPGAALDEIFDDHELWLELHARTGQPQE